MTEIIQLLTNESVSIALLSIKYSVSNREYNSHEFAQFCKDRGISHEFTCPYTPEQNGVSERLNCTLIETARSMIYHAKVPLKFWAEAVNTAVYLHNRSPTSELKDKTPFECWLGEKPDASNLRVFGCIYALFTHQIIYERSLIQNQPKQYLLAIPLV